MWCAVLVTPSRRWLWRLDRACAPLRGVQDQGTTEARRHADSIGVAVVRHPCLKFGATPASPSDETRRDTVVALRANPRPGKDADAVAATMRADKAAPPRTIVGTLSTRAPIWAKGRGRSGSAAATREAALMPVTTTSPTFGWRGVVRVEDPPIGCRGVGRKPRRHRRVTGLSVMSPARGTCVDSIIPRSSPVSWSGSSPIEGRHPKWNGGSGRTDGVRDLVEAICQATQGPRQ